MIKCSYFYGKKILVFGMARTGMGAANALLHSGAEVFIQDDNVEVLERAAALCPSTKTVSLREIDWQNLDYIVLSPGVSLYAPQPHEVVRYATQYGVQIISDLDILYLACPNARYIGVTGTNGKSTTVALIEHVLKKLGCEAQAGGNIGISAADLAPQEEGFYVLELSSYQLDLVKFLHLDTALFLNITADHIDRHGTFERYLEAKSHIMNILQPQGTGVASLDYEGTKNVNIPANKLYISTVNQDADIYIKDRILYDKKRGIQYTFQDYQHLPGQHNEENIAAAYAAISAEGFAPELVVQAIKTFTGLPHRIEKIYQSSRYVFINDSKGTNAEATEKALLCYNDLYWIAGGVTKEGGIRSIMKQIQHHVRLALLIGQAQDSFAVDLMEAGVPFIMAGTLEVALDYLKSLANGCGVVLLSPACASFDQFRDYVHRGEEFTRLVKAKFQDDRYA